MPGAIDLHSHVLPGLDDGAATLKESLELARDLAASGVRVLAATPHVSERYPTTQAQMEKGLKSLRLALSARGVAIDVVQGAEIALDQLEHLDEETLRAFTIAGTGKFVLLEFPYDGWPADLAEQLSALAAKGVTAVLAHPERNALVQAAPERLSGLLEAGALVQVNAGSLTRRAGSAGAAARRLLDNGLVHVIASDSHRPGSRPTIAAAAAELPDSLARWLTWDAPEAVLAGERPPPPPPRRRRRFAR